MNVLTSDVATVCVIVLGRATKKAASGKALEYIRTRLHLSTPALEKDSEYTCTERREESMALHYYYMEAKFLQKLDQIL